jgi:hypothetical protein
MSDEMEIEVGEELEEAIEGFLVDEVFPDEDDKQRLIQYLQTELEECYDGKERSEIEKDWQEWRRMASVKPRSRVKNTPWANASNVVTPFMFSSINGIQSHVKAAVTEKEPRVKVKSTDSEWCDHEKPLTEFLNNLMASKLHMDVKAYDDELAHEVSKMGMYIYEIPWTVDKTQFKRRDEFGNPMVVDKVIYEGPGWKSFRLEDVAIRNDWPDHQKAPLIGLRHYFTEQDMMLLSHDGFFQNVDKVMGLSEHELEDSRVVERSQIGVSTSVGSTDIGKPYEVIKCYVKWDADQDNIPEDLIVWFERKSGQILKAEWNTLSRRPIAIPRYIAINGEFYAMGAGWVLQHLQEEIDTLHNLRIDGLHVSTLQMLITRRGSGIGPDEEFFPLKNIQLDDPSSDWAMAKFPNTAHETIESEHMAKNDGKTAVGISDNQLGMPDPVAKSGTSPTLQQFLSQQGNKVLRSLIHSVQKGYEDGAMYTLMQCVANSDAVLETGHLLKLVKEEDQEKVREVLAMNVEDIPEKFTFIVESTRPDETEDAKRQLLMTKMQLYNQFIQQAMQLQMMFMQAQEPEFKNFVGQLIVGMSKLMEDTLMLLDTKNPGDYIPMYDNIELMVNMLKVMQKPQIEQMKARLEEMENGELSGSSRIPVGHQTPGYTANEGPVQQGGMGGNVPVPQAQAGPPAQGPPQLPGGAAPGGAGGIPRNG